MTLPVLSPPERLVPSDETLWEQEQRHSREILRLEKENLMLRIESLEDKTETSEVNARTALEKALEANEKRLDALNELRQMSQDRDRNFVAMSKFEGLEGRVGRVEKFVWLLMGAFILLNVLARFLPQITAGIGSPAIQEQHR